MKKTYKVTLKHASNDLQDIEWLTGLSLKEAQSVCNNSENSSYSCEGEMSIAYKEKHGHWFFAFTEETE